ncbi:MAG: VOC family protein [Desulfobacterales bacterium]|nr:VOC family protein [Desulfobacterales bacterium]
MKYRYNHFHIICSDLDRTIDFFCNTLGAAKLLERQNFGGAEGANLDMAGATFSLRLALAKDKITGDSLETRYGYDHLGLEVDNVDETYEVLKAKGVQFSMPPTALPNIGKKIAFLKGPDNITIEILHYL